MGAEVINPEQFVEAVLANGVRGSLETCVMNMEDPPGRNPPEQLLQLHHWWATQGTDQQAMVQVAMASAVELAVFGVLCMLDNVAPTVDGFRETLRLKVVSESGVERDLVPEGDYTELHGLFRNRIDRDRLAGD